MMSSKQARWHIREVPKQTATSRRAASACTHFATPNLMLELNLLNLLINIKISFKISRSHLDYYEH
jgi:hypothetical protein